MSNLNSQLNGKKVAILATNGFEQSELLSPRSALLEAGAEVEVVSLERDDITGWDENQWGKRVSVDRIVSETDSVNMTLYYYRAVYLIQILYAKTVKLKPLLMAFSVQAKTSLSLRFATAHGY